MEELIPADYNPRIDLQPHDPEYQRLKKAIDEFDYIEPIVWNERTGRIVGGHQRIKILKEKGLSEIDVSVVNLPDEKEKALNLALNKTGGDFDYPRLKDLLEELDTGAFDIEITGFGEDEIEELMNQFFKDDDIQEEDDFDPEAEADAIVNPVSQIGDIWQLGRHRLFVGDATNPEHMRQLMDGKQADCIFTDPPYNVNYEGQKGMKIQNDKQTDSAFFQFLLNSFKNMFENTKAGCPFYICHADSEGLNFRKAVVDSGFDFKQALIWVKNSLVLGRQDYHWKHEPILYGWKGGAAHRWYGMRDKTTVFDDDVDIKKLSKKELIKMVTDYRNFENTTVIRVDKPTKNDMHPTMKPLHLVRTCLQNSTKRNDLVIDTFLGSGSTLIASEQLGRVCFGIEFDPIYADVIIKRFEQFAGKQAVKINDE